MALVRRWRDKEEAALKNQLTAKGAAVRFEGMGQARRNEAVAFLIATVPALIASILFAPYDAASAVGKVTLTVTLAWAALILLAVFAFVIRALVRIGRTR